jgi:hypothetical protein
VATTSSTRRSPASATSRTVHQPLQPNGTMIRWSITPSGTLPSASPARTEAPASTLGVKAQRRSRSIGARYWPRARK